MGSLHSRPARHHDAVRFGKQRRAVVVSEERRHRSKKKRKVSRQRAPDPPMEVRKAWKLAILLRDGFTCRRCGFVGDCYTMTVDHRVPVSRGGAKRDPRNLQAMCRGCNLDKGNALE